MRVIHQYDPVRQSHEVYALREINGQQQFLSQGRLGGDAGPVISWFDLRDGERPQPWLVVDAELWEVLLKELLELPVEVETSALREHRDDAVATRDRLLTLIELGHHQA